MNERARSPEAGVFSRLASWGRYQIGDTYSAANEGLKGRVVADIAERGEPRHVRHAARHRHQRRPATILWPLPSDSDLKSWQMRAEAWDHPLVLIGGSDAGAHLDRMCGAPYTTSFLADTLRGRQLVSLERCVQLMTQTPAQLFGLRERGELREGYHADVVLFDPRSVATGEVKLVNDLPGGSAGCSPTRSACTHVIVNGTTIVNDGDADRRAPGHGPALRPRHLHRPDPRRRLSATTGVLA